MPCRRFFVLAMADRRVDRGITAARAIVTTAHAAPLAAIARARALESQPIRGQVLDPPAGRPAPIGAAGKT